MQISLRRALKSSLMELHYNGFTQLDNVREFIFHGVSPGEETKIILVAADLSLFAKHHVALQEGPLLCQRKLSSELPTLSSAQSVLPRELCENDISAFAADREREREKRTLGRKKRTWPIS